MEEERRAEGSVACRQNGIWREGRKAENVNNNGMHGMVCKHGENNAVKTRTAFI